MIKVDNENDIPARLPLLLFGKVPPVISPLVKRGEELRLANNVLNNTPPGQTNCQTKQGKKKISAFLWFCTAQSWSRCWAPEVVMGQAKRFSGGPVKSASQARLE